jgi:hypothetical protein
MIEAPMSYDDVDGLSVIRCKEIGFFKGNRWKTPHQVWVDCFFYGFWMDEKLLAKFEIDRCIEINNNDVDAKHWDTTGPTIRGCLGTLLENANQYTLMGMSRKIVEMSQEAFR